MSEQEELEKRIKYIVDNTIYEIVHGSHAYGTNIATSDKDMKGICILPDKRIYFGLQEFNQQDKGWGCDKVVYHLPKFVQLAGECNPNIIEVLYADESSIIKIDEYGKKLRDNRHLFISKRARHSFSGYAHSQLHRIQLHYKWLKGGEIHKPYETDFRNRKIIDVGPSGTTEFGEKTKILRVIDKYTINKDGEVQEWWKLEVETYDRTGHEKAVKDYNHYNDWKTNRNKVRSELEAKHGYDTKHAMHLVRLLRMGVEILTTGQVLVKRPDAEELLSIRHGAWSYEKVVDYANEIDNKLDELEKSSDLQWSPDWKKIEELQIELIEKRLKDVR